MTISKLAEKLLYLRTGTGNIIGAGSRDGKSKDLVATRWRPRKATTWLNVCIKNAVSLISYPFLSMLPLRISLFTAGCKMNKKLCFLFYETKLKLHFCQTRPLPVRLHNYSRALPWLRQRISHGAAPRPGGKYPVRKPLTSMNSTKLKSHMGTPYRMRSCDLSQAWPT